MKIKTQRIKKTHEGDIYSFVNGIAKVPDMFYGRGIYRRQVTITLKEFNEIIRECASTKRSVRSR